MTKNLFFLCAFFIHSNFLFAHNKFGVKTGVTLSTFQNVKSEYDYNINLGLFKDIKIMKGFNLSLEIIYMEYGGILRKLSVEPSADYIPGDNIYFYDFFCSIGYLEIPLQFKFNIPLNQSIIMQTYFGFAYSIPIPLADKTMRKNQKIIENPDSTKYNFDVISTGAGATGNGRLSNFLYGVNFGFAFEYKKILLDFRYCHKFNVIGSVDTVVEMNFIPHSFNVSFGFIF